MTPIDGGRHRDAHALVIVGGGGHAKVVADILRRRGDYAIAGYTDAAGRHDFDLRYLGNDGALARLVGEGVKYAFVAIGDNAARARLGAMLRRFGYLLPTVACPSAIISASAVLGGGALLASGCVVNADTRVDEFAIVNTRASVDHDCRVGAAAHIAPGATLLGRVTVGPGALVGAGATVIGGITIDPGAVVGAGAVVTRPVHTGGVVAGVPARPLGTPEPAAPDWPAAVAIGDSS